MPKYRVDTDKGSYMVETEDAPQSAQPQQDSIEQGLNYHTGNSLVDAPLGVAQGAVKSLFKTVHGGIELANRFGAHIPEDQARVAATTQPNGIGQGTGMFLGDAAQYAVPAGEVAGALKGAGTLARMAGQAAVGGAVAGVQSGGDPVATATGAVLGGGAEAAGAALKGARGLLAAKSPTLANFSESFGGATPTQKARLTKALPTLIKDGITPADDVHATQDVINGKISDIQDAYNNLDPAIRARQQPASVVIKRLQDVQSQFMRRGVVTDDAAYNAVQGQIDKVTAIADKNNGNVDLDDLVHLKQKANGRTNFASPDADKSLWKNIGDSLRGAADKLAPETTPLNRDYATYNDVKDVIDQNIARGKGTTPSGLDLLLRRAASHGAGAAAGASLGGAVAGAPGAALGSIAGGIAGPRLAKATMQALQNAVDSGQLAALSGAKRQALTVAAKMGDNATVLKMLTTAPTQATATNALSQ